MHWIVLVILYIQNDFSDKKLWKKENLKKTSIKKTEVNERRRCIWAAEVIEMEVIQRCVEGKSLWKRLNC